KELEIYRSDGERGRQVGQRGDPAEVVHGRRDAELDGAAEPHGGEVVEGVAPQVGLSLQQLGISGNLDRRCLGRHCSWCLGSITGCLFSAQL
uniref:Uncharacterized protein n=1 Tax=Triticum urartu TaxID=4572 RepID=A0A8R7PMQ8_TRIUA